MEPSSPESSSLPFFSVIIPALNEEAALPRCLESIAAQADAPPTEVIVVDNGSTDRTPEIALACGARVVECPVRGVVAARHRGLDAARGDVVVQLDADSEIAPETLSVLADRFRTEHVVAVAGDVAYVPGTIGTRLMQATYRRSNGLLAALTGRPRFALAGAIAVRREPIIRTGGYLEDLPYSGDEAGLLSRMAREGKVVWEPRFVVRSSDRRFRGRFLSWLLSDLFFHTFLDQTAYRLTHHSRWGFRPSFR